MIVTASPLSPPLPPASSIHFRALQLYATLGIELGLKSCSTLADRSSTTFSRFLLAKGAGGGGLDTR